MFKTSAAVLRSSKELTVFPVLSGVASLAVTVTFVVPIAASDLWDRSAVLTYVLFGAMYLASAFVTVFFNAALISQADLAMRGGDPSVAGGVRAAGARWPRILVWALISATVSQVLRIVQDRLGFLGTILTAIAGTAWQVVSFLVLPKMVLADRGLVDAVKDSAESMKRTWGENVVGNVGLGVFGVLLMIPGALLVIAGLLAVGTSVAVAVLGVLLGSVWVILAAVVVSALTGIYQTALYRYSVDGVVPVAFGNADLAHAFGPR
ncbi:DUF6159 family protein [Nocardia sp. AG03]|uniref:DUF6159 family protein n=1 Tax=Nocardia sp. AG03 TaxID=3025312 RepID=UPI0024184B69|nr:DUF6159 family protein [Nocardia sp. AG03]